MEQTRRQQRDNLVFLAEMTRSWHGEFKLKHLLTEVFQSYQIARPKHRWLGLEGEIKIGKSTLARAIMDLFGGINIGLNTRDDSRLTFQLSMAIGLYYVLFDDVTNPGFKNIDNKLRDYLDGGHKVNLEKKGKDFTFSPGILITNRKELPSNLTCQIKFLNCYQILVGWLYEV